MGWRHPELCEWEGNQEINFPFLGVTPFCPREDQGPRTVACLFQLGKGGGNKRQMPNNLLGVLVFAKHLGLNVSFQLVLLSSLLSAIPQPSWGLEATGGKQGSLEQADIWEQG